MHSAKNLLVLHVAEIIKHVYDSLGNGVTGVLGCWLGLTCKMLAEIVVRLTCDIHVLIKFF